jgi:alkylation response protein AidB-like acyl-CoA dehydrogenase
VAGPLFDRHLRDWVALADGPLVDLCLFLEEAGVVLLPGPFFATSALFAPLLRAAGHPRADEAVEGSTTGTVALAGADGWWRVSDDAVRTFVLEVDRVDDVAIVLPGPSVALVPTARLGPRPVETLDSTRRVFEIDLPRDLDDVRPVDGGALDRVVERATVALAAELIGTARWLLDTTLRYARERIQFGQPIGAFQGLQWKLVDMSLDWQRAAAAVAYAAMTLDGDDPDRHRATHVAKAAAGNAARRAAKDGLQIHGGIGYTWEHDLHLYLRRAYASDDLLGDAAWHHDRLAALLLG